MSEIPACWCGHAFGDHDDLGCRMCAIQPMRVIKPEHVYERDVRLTAREVELLTALVDADTVSDAGARLGISAQTAKNHLTHVYAKLGTGGLLNTYRRLGWLRVPR